MSGSKDDSAGKSPALLAGPPRRGIGVRRLNKVPTLIVLGVGAVVAGAVSYTVYERSAHHHSAADDKKGEAGRASILDNAPDAGVASADTPGRTHHGKPTAPAVASAPTDHPAGAAQEDAAIKFRRAAWETYYKELAELEKQRHEQVVQALQAGTATGSSSSGAAQLATAIGGSIGSGSSAGGFAPPVQEQEEAQAAGYDGAAPGGGYGGGRYGGFGGGYGGGRPVQPDTTGAREKQSFGVEQSAEGDVNSDTLHSTVRDPISPYLVTAGDAIPCVMQGGATSDTPGQMVGRTQMDIYDSATGKFLLIPNHSKVIGTYDNVVSAGQGRLPAIIKRIIFPDSSSIDIGGMSAADEGGYAGLHDQVKRHLWEKFGNAVILAGGAAAVQLSQGGQNSNGYNSQQIIAGSLGQQFGELGQEYARSGLSIPNTLEIRPGYKFVIQITKDMVLRPYVDRRTLPTQAAIFGSFMQ